MLPKKHKITNRRIIPNILNNGKSISTPLFVIKYIYNKEKDSHFGIITSAKISKKAVERNKARRRIYEAIRHFLNEQGDTEKNIDAIFLAKKSCLEADYETISKTISNNLSKIL